MLLQQFFHGPQLVSSITTLTSSAYSSFIASGPFGGGVFPLSARCAGTWIKRGQSGESESGSRGSMPTPGTGTRLLRRDSATAAPPFASGAYLSCSFLGFTASEALDSSTGSRLMRGARTGDSATAGAPSRRAAPPSSSLRAAQIERGHRDDFLSGARLLSLIRPFSTGIHPGVRAMSPTIRGRKRFILVLSRARRGQ